MNDNMFVYWDINSFLYLSGWWAFPREQFTWKMCRMVVSLQVAAHVESCSICSYVTLNFRSKESTLEMKLLAWSRQWYFHCLTSNISLLVSPVTYTHSDLVDFWLLVCEQGFREYLVYCRGVPCLVFIHQRMLDFCLLPCCKASVVYSFQCLWLILSRAKKTLCCWLCFIGFFKFAFFK